MLNPQKNMVPIISRINYTSQNEDGLNELHRLVISELNNIIDKFAIMTYTPEIYDIVLVGNTNAISSMYSCKQIAIFPLGRHLLKY